SLIRQCPKQLVTRHHRLLRINDRSESHSWRNPIHSAKVVERFTSSEVRAKASLEGRRPLHRRERASRTAPAVALRGPRKRAATSGWRISHRSAAAYW